MAEILVTGATGRLGPSVVSALAERGNDVRSLSRKLGPRVVTGDLVTGEGVRDALADASIVMHLATGHNDAKATGKLVDAASAAGVRHLIYMSIVGADAIPLSYYKTKSTAEHVVENSGLPYTILRTTQFHSFVDNLFHAESRLPVLPIPTIDIQPIDVADVAWALSDIAEGAPSGHVPDLGGPEILAANQLAEMWVKARHIHRKIVSLPVPGRAFAAFRAGNHLVPTNRSAGITFGEYLQRAQDPRA
ncbi:MAG TPA: NAD(P)H-binding protein [Glaciihabitans sp.]|jgi:uncharacterized protein YbjT (DUF2867 family)|nr:NAD(P)H-binding protein [Glaciihabitans sp.]